MKKTLLAAVVAGCAAFSGAALADDGQVKFIGDIIDAGCDVVNDLSNPLEVQMGQIAKTSFSGTGSTAAEQNFAILTLPKAWPCSWLMPAKMRRCRSIRVLPA